MQLLKTLQRLSRAVGGEHEGLQASPLSHCWIPAVISDRGIRGLSLHPVQMTNSGLVEPRSMFSTSSIADSAQRNGVSGDCNVLEEHEFSGVTLEDFDTPKTDVFSFMDHSSPNALSNMLQGESLVQQSVSLA